MSLDQVLSVMQANASPACARYPGPPNNSRPLPSLGAHATPKGVVHIERTRFVWRERLYERLGFRRILPFGRYTDDPLSRCYERSVALN